MSTKPANVHATAIVVGSTGLLFLGPSGAGKSSTALACLHQAQIEGQFAALVADDQVLLETVNDILLMRCPATTRNLLEVRGSGLIRIDSIPVAIADLAVQMVDPATAERLPEDNEVWRFSNEINLPLVRLASGSAFPLDILRRLAACRQDFRPINGTKRKSFAHF